MVCSSVKGKLVYSSKDMDFIELEWFERDKRGLKKLTVGGEEIELDTGTVLADRDIVYEDKDRLIAVRLKPCEVMSVRVNSMTEIGALCYRLGSLGLAVSISGEWVKFPFDEAAADKLRAEGFYGQVSEEIFDSFILPSLKYSDKTL